MELEFDKVKYSLDSDGAWLMLRIPSGLNAIRRFLSCWKDKPHIAKLFEKRNRRSLDANAYFWVLCDKLSAALRISKEETYRNLIRDIGGNSETVCVQTAAVEKLKKGWGHNGLGWVVDTFPSKIEGCTNVTSYYGSSTYDTEQMSRLIDNTVQDCKAVGIETATPEELALMKSRWDDAQANKSA